MTAEIVDLGKYREEKKRIRNKTPIATPETGLEPLNETPLREPVRARLDELREKDKGEPP